MNHRNDAADLASLAHTPPHEFSPDQWSVYYPPMARRLHDSDPQSRLETIKQLAESVLWSEFSGRFQEAGDPSPARQRVRWLLDQIESANAVHGDVLAAFLRQLVHAGHLEPCRTPLLEWLAALGESPRVDVDAGLAMAARISVEGDGGDRPAHLPEWLSLLDHPSDWVRACAAYRLGECDEDGEASADALFALIGEKEIVRPGIAGPFWSSRCFRLEGHEAAMYWMLDLLERRSGPAPTDLPYNDIEFHLHEACCFSPELVERMLRGGFVRLALMTATEVHEPVEGMQSILARLAGDTDASIATAASEHLRRVYLVV